MTDGNPLVAQRQDSTTAYSGIGIVESAVDLHNGIANGSWVEGGLGLVGGGLETLSLVIDPVGTLVSYGIAWLMEHVQPLSDALDWLAGDGDTIASYAQTWRNVAQVIGQARADYDTAVRTDTAAWTGAAGDAYRASAAGQSEQLGAAAVSAETVGTVVEVVGVLVGVVREVVRDLIAECVATLIARIPQWLAEVGVTLGIATPHVIASVVALVSKWVARISDVLVKLVRSVEKLRPLLRHLDEIWEAIRSGLRGLSPSGPNSPNTPGSTPSGTTPTVRDPSTVDTPTVTSDGPPPTSTTPTTPTTPVSDTPTVNADAPTSTAPSSTAPQGATTPVSTVDAPSSTTPQSGGPPTDPPPPPTDGPGSGGPGDGNGPPPPRTPDDPPPPGPGSQSLGTVPEARVTRDGDGLITHVDNKPVDQYLREVMDQRAAAYRDGVGTDFSKKEIGPVTSVAIDRQTGEIFEATNGRPRDIIAPDELHPLLQQRLDDLRANGPYPKLDENGVQVVDADGVPQTQPYPHGDHPLRHAEVKAVNQLLWARGADADPGVFGDLRVDNSFPFGADGPRSAPCCVNCHNLLQGVPSNAGRFTGWPPGPHNFVEPE